MYNNIVYARNIYIQIINKNIDKKKNRCRCADGVGGGGGWLVMMSLD